MIRVTTETGSIYDFDQENMRTRRVNTTGNFEAMRKDGEWSDLVLMPDIKIGASMRFPLVVREDGDVTFRTTSYVTKIEDTE